MFLEQLIRTLLAEEQGNAAEGTRISGPAGGDVTALSQIGVTATVHGHALLELGFTVDQVVHAYGDLCQAITDLAIEREAPFSVDQFRTLNRCLDNAIADAVTEFSAQRQALVSRRQLESENERLGVLVHEFRNSLHTATMAFAALESGTVAVGGATGALLKRSLGVMSNLLDRSVEQVRDKAGTSDGGHAFLLAAFIADAKSIASLGANTRGCGLVVPQVDAGVAIAGNRDHLLAALVNLLQNAFKFTRPHTDVTLHARVDGDRVAIDVKDHCGGLAPGSATTMFTPFSQGGFDRSGLGLGLAIARRSIEAEGGGLTVRDVPGTGCVFTMSLPRCAP